MTKQLATDADPEVRIAILGQFGDLAGNFYNFEFWIKFHTISSRAGVCFFLLRGKCFLRDVKYCIVRNCVSMCEISYCHQDPSFMFNRFVNLPRISIIRFTTNCNYSFKFSSNSGSIDVNFCSMFTLYDSNWFMQTINFNYNLFDDIIFRRLNIFLILIIKRYFDCNVCIS